MGTTIFHTGDTGSGHAMKALNNFVSAAGLVAANALFQIVFYGQLAAEAGHFTVTDSIARVHD